MSSFSGYGSVPSEPLPEHERPDWMRPAAGLPGTSAEPPTAPYGYPLDAPGSSSPQPPYLARPPYEAQPPAGPASLQPYPGQQPSQQAGQPPHAQQGYSVPVPPAGYPGTGHGVQQPGYQQAGYQPGYPQPGAPWAPDAYAKSRVAAGLLGIFLGALGVHRFYTGHTGVGIIMLLITVLSFGTLSFVTGVWGLVEGILYLTDRTGSYSRDARGRPLRG